MSKQGLAVAKLFGRQLPSFGGLAEAEASLHAKRDFALNELTVEPALRGQLDYTPESLDRLEHWFFSADEPNQLKSGLSVADAIGYYTGEVYCRCAGFTWTVRESVFVAGRYEIGVTRGLTTIMLTIGKAPMATNNKRMRSIRRAFDRYAASNVHVLPNQKMQ